MFVVAIDGGFVLNQDLYGLFPGELDGLAGGHFSASLVDEFSLLFRVQGGVESEVFFSLYEIPVKFDSVVGAFVKGVVWHSEEGTLDGGHEAAASRN
jgi:hypothetical protein